jgi:hypothetical protein
MNRSRNVCRADAPRDRLGKMCLIARLWLHAPIVADVPENEPFVIEMHGLKTRATE